jgi:hypothetical protein
MNSYLEAVEGAVLIGFTLIFSPLLRSRYNRWGAAPAETTQPLPGDGLVPQPVMGYTHAITIHAPAAEVWRWVVQIGQGRGGFYSYDVLENIVGCQIHSADRVKPELQMIQVGDNVRLGPQGFPLFRVGEVVPGQALVLRAADPQTSEVADFTDPMPEASAPTTWVFYVQPVDEATSRLIVRQRLYHAPKWMFAIMWRLVEPVNFVMERKMMLTIRWRAEAGGRQ